MKMPARQPPKSPARLHIAYGDTIAANACLFAGKLVTYQGVVLTHKGK